MSEEKAQKLLKRYNALKSDKEVYDTHYQEIADFFLPDKGDFNRLHSPGEKRNRELYTQAPQNAIDVSSSSLIGLIANPASRWFYIEMIDEELNRDSRIAGWCEKAGQTLLNYISIPDAMFYQNLKSALEDALAFGVPSMYVNENEDGGLEFGAKTVHSFVIAENHKGVVDTVFNEIKMTHRQIMQKVDIEGWSVDDELRKLANEKPDGETDVIHAIMPREDARSGSLNPKVLPIAGFYVDKKRGKILKETGYHEMPQPVARWRKAVNEVYGRSQAMIALADAQTLNVAVRMFMTAVEKQNDPNVFLPNDSNPSKVDFTAGGVTYFDATKGNPVFFTATGDLGVAYQFIKDLEAAIRTALYVDQLQMVGGTDMTATEVLQRQNEKARLLAPAIGRIQTELISPLLERSLNILIRNGSIEQPPEELRDKPYKVSYTTAITRAQRQLDEQNIMSVLSTAMNLVQFDPSLAMRIDMSKTFDELMDIRGVTGIMKRDEAEIQEMQEQAAMAQEAQQMMQMAQGGADIAKTANEAGLLE